MARKLHYGRIVWSYEDGGEASSLRPTPLLKFRPIRVHGKLKVPHFSDRTILQLMKLKSSHQLTFKNAYTKWLSEDDTQAREWGEGRAFYRWLLRYQKSIRWIKNDFEFHALFQGANCPRHAEGDEFAKGLSFALRPVELRGRRVKLYLEDESVLSLIGLSFGEETDFLELVRRYVLLRFELETWKAPAPPFLDWVKAQGKRPIFRQGQLGFCPGITFGRD